MENKKGLVMANAASRKTSAVIATYNHESFAYRSIESIAAQVDEVVVIDDNSTDGTKKELERARKDFGNLKIILNSANAGVSVSLNTAIQQATSDFIFLSAGDDLSLPHRVPYQFAQLKANPEGFFFATPQVIDGNERILNRAKAPEFLDRVAQKDVYFRLLTQGNYLCATSAAFSKENFLMLGGFEQGLEQLQDWALWLKVAGTGQLQVSDRPVSIYRKHFGNLSGSNNGKRAEVLFRARIETAYILSKELESIRVDTALSNRVLEALNMTKSFNKSHSLVADSLRKLLSKQLQVDPRDVRGFLALSETQAKLRDRSSEEFYDWVTSQPS